MAASEDVVEGNLNDGIDFQKELGTENLEFDDLNFSTEVIDHEDLMKMTDDLLKFQQDDIVKEALEQGVNLGMYAKQIEKELQQVEINSIEDYVSSGEQLFQLHSEIATCDGILQKMQSMLSGFQNHLKTISGEINHLQEESLSMAIKLNNRKKVESEVARFVDGLAVSPELITNICEAVINKDYVGYLIDLNCKIQFSSSLPPTCSILDDVIPVLDNLKCSAISRVRAFMIKKVQDLKIPQTNIQIKQNHILDFKYLSTFLADHSPEIALEIKTVYKEAMTKVYIGLFRSYLNNMNKLKNSKCPEKGDVIGLDGTKTGGFFSSSRTNQQLNQYFAIHERYDILTSIDDVQIVPHVALKKPHRYHYEVIFRSTTKLLMDTATSEYMFVRRFFNGSGLFDQVFEKTLALFSEKLEDFLFNCYDCFCLLLMIRILREQQNRMSQRKLKCLNRFFNDMNMKLWPRFKIVFDENLDSVRTYRISQTDIRTIKDSPSFIHFTTMRYANFVNALLLLSNYQDDDSVNNARYVISNLESFREEIEKLLLRLANHIENPKMHCVFLINNYDVIVTVLRKNELTKSQEFQRFKELAEEQKTMFVEELLRHHLGGIIECVTTLERAAERDPACKLDQTWVQNAGSKFAGSWRNELQSIDRYIHNHFTPNIPADMAQELGDILRNQNEILKQVLVQLLLYYRRFESIVELIRRNQDTNFQVEIIPIQTIRFEMRKLAN